MGRAVWLRVDVSWPRGDERPASTAVDAADLFGRERDRLLALLRQPHPGDWELPTPCPKWNVLGLCSHLLGDDLAWLARHRDNHHGTRAPAGDEDAFTVWLDALQSEWVHAARRLSPRLMTDLLAWTVPPDRRGSHCTGTLSDHRFGLMG
jgi:hypothetical protein